jgi:hypothetical protein
MAPAHSPKYERRSDIRGITIEMLVEAQEIEQLQTSKICLGDQ